VLTGSVIESPWGSWTASYDSRRAAPRDLGGALVGRICQLPDSSPAATMLGFCVVA